MAILKAKHLKHGDVIGVISPASAPDDLSRVNSGVTYLEKLGFRVEVGKNVGSKEGYLAGSDEQRLSDLHDMFRNKTVKAIFTVRGGYGSGRLLGKVDYNLIKKNPKIFVGYSDLTALQLAIYSKTGLITFAGPMVAVDFHDEINSFTEENFWKVITSNKKIGKLKNPKQEKFYTLNKGRAVGRILGGNLSILISLLGTEYFPKLKDSILLLEDINEAPYRIDRMFNQLILSKQLKQVKGITLGYFRDCVEQDSSKPTFSLNEVITEYLIQKIKLPTIYNVKHGHVKDNLTIPIGVKAILNASNGILEIPESGVS